MWAKNRRENRSVSSFIGRLNLEISFDGLGILSVLVLYVIAEFWLLMSLHMLMKVLAHTKAFFWHSYSRWKNIQFEETLNARFNIILSRDSLYFSLTWLWWCGKSPVSVGFALTFVSGRGLFPLIIIPRCFICLCFLVNTKWNPPSLSFTMELDNNDRLPFLGIMIIRNSPWLSGHWTEVNKRWFDIIFSTWNKTGKLHESKNT